MVEQKLTPVHNKTPHLHHTSSQNGLLDILSRSSKLVLPHEDNTAQSLAPFSMLVPCVERAHSLCSIALYT